MGLPAFRQGVRGRYAVLEPTKTCNGWSGKRQKYCRAPAGRETDHVGEGRCKYHDGRPPTHGWRSARLAKRPTLGERTAMKAYGRELSGLGCDVLSVLEGYAEGHPGVTEAALRVALEFAWRMLPLTLYRVGRGRA